MAAGRDEVVAVLVLDALPVTTITMSAYDSQPRGRRALCMLHSTPPPFAPHRSHPCSNRSCMIHRVLMFVTSVTY